MNKSLGILFGFSCFATAYVSNSLLGAGMWFYVIILAGSFVAFSQFINWFRAAGVVIAVLLSVISVLAFIFGGLASTVGGGSIDNQTLLLLVFFACISICGFALSRAHKRLSNETETNPDSPTE